MSDEMVTLATYRSAPQADLARALLEESGIQAFVVDADMATLIVANTVGFVKLEVAADQAVAALEIFRQNPELLDTGPLGEAAAEADIDGETGAMKCLACGAVMSEGVDICPQCGWSYDAGRTNADGVT